jgi:mannose-6-phosphate isomerase-like protein (cupin superfamily)
MSRDITVRRLDELPAYGDGVFQPVAVPLGVTSFGMNIMRWPPHSSGHPEHDERKSGQEEVYFVLSGSGRLVVSDEEIALERGVVVRVGPGERRRMVTDDDELEVLCLGAVPGEPFRGSGPAHR